MIVDQSLREELIKEFERFAEEGSCSGCFQKFIGYKKLKLMRIQWDWDCTVCYILFPKLREFAMDHEQGCILYNYLIVDTTCMCHFLKTKDFQVSVKKAWKYINGEWG
jgi:hypothetical protein